MNSPLLAIEDLQVQFRGEAGIARAVTGATLHLERGEVLALVGESGCGKSVTALAVMGLLPMPPAKIVAGRIVFDGTSLIGANPRLMRSIRGRRMAMIFQDPMTSLNPYLRVGRQLTEVLELHLGHTRRQATQAAAAMLERAGISEASRRMRAYPHELSGGMRQRVMIAMALLCKPQLLIADEPTTALDVTVAAEILDLISELQRSTNMAVLLITHDLGIVARLADRVAVMYAGRPIEDGAATSLVHQPLHPYTQGLLRSRPSISAPLGRALPTLSGRPPEPTRLPKGCAFAPRCAQVGRRCVQERPTSVDVHEGRHVACFVHQTGGVDGAI